MDISSSLNPAENVMLVNIVNRDFHNRQNLAIHVIDHTLGNAVGKQITHLEADAVNSFDNPENLKIQEFTCDNSTTIEVPPLSVTVLQIKLT